MQNDPPILQCPNYFCQALNPVSYRFCSHCQTMLPKRFLWLVGAEAARPGELVGDRYLVTEDHIALDTKPGSAPEMPTDVTPDMEPYLRLISYRSHVPQLYAVVHNQILLLDWAAIYPEGAQSAQGENLTGTLMPAIAQVWHKSSALRQLNLLWQWAQLWQPLSLEKVTSTLLDPARLRIDGGTLKITELGFDRTTSPTLMDLGQVWSQWQVQPEISEFFQQLCQNLISGAIASSEQLVASLEQALTACGQNQTRQIRFATLTDQGPSRQSNEDECYPSSGSSFSSDQTLPLVIVCDGIGGHEGGEVASQIAIEAIANQAQMIAVDQPAEVVTETLAEAIFHANDLISQRNDAEQRQERQRMGTTVVMGLAHAHEFYIAHIGDSRAYRITRTGCYQVTLDDDVASREVRLGYTLYGEALQRPSAGSLVQALGMGSSNYLHPNVQRFVLDEDCVFLLCSDGLSDNDRVEEIWQTEIAPILDGKLEVANAARKLIEVANTRNGHDNVTVGVIHCQVSDRAKNSRSIAATLSQPTQVSVPATTLQTTPPGTAIKTQITRRPRNWLSIALTLLGLLGLGGILAVLLVPEIRNTFVSTPPSPSPAPPAIASPQASPVTTLTQNTFVRLDRQPNSIPLLDKPELGLSPQVIVGQIPPGTLLQVVSKRQTAIDQPMWVRLKVCSPGTPSPGSTNAVFAGATGWQQEATIVPFVSQLSNPTPDELGACSTPPTPNSPENLRDNANQPR